MNDAVSMNAMVTTEGVIEIVGTDGEVRETIAAPLNEWVRVDGVRVGEKVQHRRADGTVDTRVRALGPDPREGQR